MEKCCRFLIVLIALIVPVFASAVIVGTGKADITPPIGTPSAGYTRRNGIGMEGVHDPLYAISLFIDNGEKKIVLCSVDHLGFTLDMTKEIIKRVNSEMGADCEIYIGSSHTHSGGGAYLNLPIVGEKLSGKFDPDITNFYVERTAEAIISSIRNSFEGKIGLGYGHVSDLSSYRASWPKDVAPLSDIAIIKVTTLEDIPLAVIFNYPIHPSVLKSQNLLFSADFVGYARDFISSLIGSGVEALYFNGAEGDIIPAINKFEEGFDSCQFLGSSLAKEVQKIWNETKTSESLSIMSKKISFAFKPEATPFGLLIPVDHYETEINAIIFNNIHAFITMPGELSTIYDKELKEIGNKLGFAHVSIFGLTNDAHGYLISPDSWKHKTQESGLSFGGENHGESVKFKAQDLLEELSTFRY